LPNSEFIAIVLLLLNKYNFYLLKKIISINSIIMFYSLIGDWIRKIVISVGIINAMIIVTGKLSELSFEIHIIIQ